VNATATRQPDCTRRDSMRQGRRRLSGERGSAAAEAALVTPLLVLLALVAVGFGRTASTRIEVASAARQAARAASIAPDPNTAVTQAKAAARAALAEDRVTCADLTVAVDTTHFAPGGTVAVTISCTTELGDAAMPGLPGRVQFRARFVSPIDEFRVDVAGGP
jgi:Flp pilus assembly protein TadG